MNKIKRANKKSETSWLSNKGKSPEIESNSEIFESDVDQNAMTNNDRESIEVSIVYEIISFSSFYFVYYFFILFIFFKKSSTSDNVTSSAPYLGQDSAKHDLPNTSMARSEDFSSKTSEVIGDLFNRNATGTEDEMDHVSIVYIFIFLS